MARKRNTKRDSVVRRITVIKLIFFLAIFFVGIVQVLKIKLVNGKEYEAGAITNQINKVQDIVVSPNRGSILDRNKQGLALSSTVFNVILDIKVLDEVRKDEEDARNLAIQNGEEYKEEEKSSVYKTFKGLSDILGIPYEEIEGYTKRDADGKLINDTNWYVLEREVPFSVGKEIQDANLKFVFLEQATKRNYPHNNFLAQVIGFTRGDNIWGLENQYNEEMTGIPGRTFRTYESDASFVTRQENPIEGYSIITTIDQTIQQYCENIVEKAYKDCSPEHTPLNTSLIVMNPNTGEILAMAQYPDFNSNKPDDIILPESSEDKANWDKMTDAQKLDVQNKTWRNFNISDSFEPGSIYKPLVVAAALEENAIKKSDRYFCQGGKTVEDRYIKCHYEAGHGSESLEEVLANSCNVGMMDIVSRLGKEKYYKYQEEFGIGEKTGIDLPDEANVSSLTYKLEGIGPVELATCSFGQGFNCTPIQALTAFSSLVNGGKIMKPYLVSQIIDENENVIRENNPEVIRKVLSEDTSDFVRNALKGVFEEGGTGYGAAIKGYSLGGKTGTAEQGDRAEGVHTLDFIAYFPAEKPQYIAMAVIHHPKDYSDGVVSTSPMIKELYENIISYEAIPPNNDENNENQNNDENNILADYTGGNLKECISSLLGAGIDFEIVGNGGDIVKKQFPEGNSKINDGTKILIYTENSGSAEKLTALPDVTGLTAEDAVKLLGNMGFEYVVEEDLPKKETTNEESNEKETNEEKTNNETVKKKEVYAQIPQAGVNLENGTLIKIKVR